MAEVLSNRPLVAYLLSNRSLVTDVLSNRPLVDSLLSNGPGKPGEAWGREVRGRGIPTGTIPQLGSCHSPVLWPGAAGAMEYRGYHGSDQ